MQVLDSCFATSPTAREATRSVTSIDARTRCELRARREPSVIAITLAQGAETVRSATMSSALDGPVSPASPSRLRFGPNE